MILSLLFLRLDRHKYLVHNRNLLYAESCTALNAPSFAGRVRRVFRACVLTSAPGGREPGEWSRCALWFKRHAPSTEGSSRSVLYRSVLAISKPTSPSLTQTEGFGSPPTSWLDQPKRLDWFASHLAVSGSRSSLWRTCRR